MAQASVKQRAEPEAEAIAITESEAIFQQKRGNEEMLERTSEEDEQGQEEPLESSRVIRHERIIKKDGRKTICPFLPSFSIIFNVGSPSLLLSFSFFCFFPPNKLY